MSAGSGKLITRDMLATRVRQLAAASGHIMALEPSAEGLAKAITGLSLEGCIAGRYATGVLTMEAAYAQCYGLTLQGKPVARRTNPKP